MRKNKRNIVMIFEEVIQEGFVTKKQVNGDNIS